MIRSLYIKNIAVAKDVEVEFRPGFTAVTGETGAGKSVMVDCLGLIAGAKSSRELIRSGEKTASVSAVFSDIHDSHDFEEFSPDENGDILITRTFSSDSRTALKVNGKPVSISELKQFAPRMIGISSQSEKEYLGDRKQLTDILDSFAGNGDVLADYAGRYSILCDMENELLKLKDSLREKGMLTDILSYQIREIDAVKLTSDEDVEKLIRLRDKIRNLEKVSKYQKLVSRALSNEEGGASYLVDRASAAVSKLGDVVGDSDEMIARLNGIRYELIDIAERVRQEADTDQIEDPEKQLNIIESRLSHIEKLKKKYGSTVKEILEFREQAASRLASLEDGDEAIKRLEKKIRDQTDKTGEIASMLTASRKSAAERLSREMTETLKQLDMPKVRFTVSVSPLKTADGRNFSPTGADDIDFLIAPNPGEPLQSVSSIASGGEMSRVLLALKCSVNDKNGAPTVIFDEIDSGVSGGTAERIGLMMRDLSKRTQVICVTHSPQIASIADHHLLIKKVEVDGRSESVIREISSDDRRNEIARIIGGIKVTDKQKAAAGEMLLRHGK